MTSKEREAGKRFVAADLLGTADKGRQTYEEAVEQLVRFVTWWKDRPKDVRQDRHAATATMPLPQGSGR